MLQDDMPGFDGSFQSGVVAALVAVAIERIGLAADVACQLVGMPGRHQVRGLFEVLSGGGVAQLCQGDVAPAGTEFRRVERTTILGLLGFLLELAGLAKARKLTFHGLVEEGIRFSQTPAVERLLGRASQFRRMRIIGCERRQRVSRLRELDRDLNELGRDLFVRHVLFAEDPENCADRGGGEPQFRRQFRRLSLGLRLGFRRGGHLIGEDLHHGPQYGRVLLVDRVVDGAVANRTADDDAFGPGSALTRSRYGPWRQPYR